MQTMGNLNHPLNLELVISFDCVFFPSCFGFCFCSFSSDRFPVPCGFVLHAIAIDDVASESRCNCLGHIEIDSVGNEANWVYRRTFKLKTFMTVPERCFRMLMATHYYYFLIFKFVVFLFLFEDLWKPYCHFIIISIGHHPIIMKKCCALSILKSKGWKYMKMAYM